MDIPGLSMAMAQNNIMSQVGVAVLSNSMDMAETTGAAITNMIDAAAMEQSVNPHIGGNFDARI